MKRTITTILAFFSLTCAATAADSQTSNPADLVIQWNETLLTYADAEDGFLTLKGLRTAAMAHIAIHDALNNVTRQYASYALNAPSTDTDPLAAATQAAYTVVANQYPQENASLLALNERWLARIPDGAAKKAGVLAGAAAARAVLRLREDDGWDTAAEYRWHPMGPGVYAEFHEHSGTPQGFVFGAGWGKAKGFALERADQFRAHAPPDINSDEYTRAFDEVKTLGRFQSISRTPDQTHLALWWKDFAENSHNRLARDLAAKENLGLRKTARLFALLNMSIFDAYVSVFDNKFFYNHWRPYTAIRWAANDGNPHTDTESTWTNTHRHTYAFPSYPSAHGTACAAAMTAFATVFGDEFSFTMYTPMVDIAGPFSGKINMQPATRKFERFSSAAKECALSRLYLGIHFRYDSTAGFNLGQDVGEHVVDNLLTESAE